MTLSELTSSNTKLLNQAVALLESIEDAAFVTGPAPLPSHKAGSHFRHVLEFYECFLTGVATGTVDYDARHRNETLEHDRKAACEKALWIARHLHALATRDDRQPLEVRVEGGDGFLRSSVGRELQVLASHTIHHFALISIALRLHGVAVDAKFGMSPSTLQFQRAETR